MTLEALPDLSSKLYQNQSIGLVPTNPTGLQQVDGDSGELDDLNSSIIRAEGLPRIENADQPTTNSQARSNSGAELRTNMSIEGRNLSCNSERATQYGQSTVTETEAGHVITLNDTLGSERILIRHCNGTGIELRPDGSIFISSTDIHFDVEGDINLGLTGSLNLDAQGDLNLNAGGKVNVSATGYSSTIDGNADHYIGGQKTETIRSNELKTVRGYTATTLVGAETITNLGGHDRNVKGDLTLRVDGDGGLYATGRVGITSAIKAFMSSPSTAINGEQIEIIGATGTIGGEGVVMYNSSSISAKSIQALTVETDAVHATRVNGTFYGDLNGTATQAGTAGSVGAGGSPGSASDTTIDLKETFAATSATTQARLKTLNNGIRQVQIDPGNYIRNSIDRSYATGG